MTVDFATDLTVRYQAGHSDYSKICVQDPCSCLGVIRIVILRLPCASFQQMTLLRVLEVVLPIEKTGSGTT